MVVWDKTESDARGRRNFRGKVAAIVDAAAPSLATEFPLQGSTLFSLCKIFV